MGTSVCDEQLFFEILEKNFLQDFGCIFYNKLQQKSCKKNAKNVSDKLYMMKIDNK